MTEIQLQASIFQHAWNHYPSTRGLFFHVPNGGSRNAIEGMQLKASGVVAGIPDMILIHHGCAYGFEIKTPSGSVSSVQSKIHKIWAQDGTPVYIVRSLEEFQTIAERILNGEVKEVAS
jgi:hypothetical protein